MSFVHRETITRSMSKFQHLSGNSDVFQDSLGEAAEETKVAASQRKRAPSMMKTNGGQDSEDEDFFDALDHFQSMSYQQSNQKL